MAKKKRRKPTKMDIYRALPRPLLMYALVVLVPYMAITPEIDKDKFFYVITLAISAFAIREGGKILRKGEDSTVYEPDQTDNLLNLPPESFNPDKNREEPYID